MARSARSVVASPSVSSVERLPPGVSYSHADNLDRTAASMHDLSYFRDHLDVFADMAKRRNITLDLDAFRAIDKERREFITANQQRKSQRNKASDEIARLKEEKLNADALIAEMKLVSEQIKQSDQKISESNPSMAASSAPSPEAFSMCSEMRFMSPLSERIEPRSLAA